MTCSRVMPRAFASASYPPTAWYSASFVRSRSSAPWSTSSCSSAIAELRDDSRHVFGARRLAVAVVDDNDRRVAAASRALERPQRDPPAPARLAHRDAELLLERLHDLLGSDERARDVRADLDEVLADGSEVVHVVEGRDGLDVRRRQVERVRDLLERLPREPAVVLTLRQPQPAHDGGAPIWIRLRRLPNLVLQ